MLVNNTGAPCLSFKVAAKGVAVIPSTTFLLSPEICHIVNVNNN